MSSHICAYLCVFVCVGRRAYVCVASIHLNVEYSNRNFTHFFQDGGGSRKVINDFAHFFQDDGIIVKYLGISHNLLYP